MTLRETPTLPQMATRPEVPEGGLGPLDDVRRHPTSVSDALSSTATDNNEYGTLTDEPRQPGGLIGTVLDLFGMNKEVGMAAIIIFDIAKSTGKAYGQRRHWQIN